FHFRKLNSQIILCGNYHLVIIKHTFYHMSIKHYPNMDKASRILHTVLIDYFYPTISNPKFSKIRSSLKNFAPQSVKSTPFLTFSLHIHAYSLHSQFFHYTHTIFRSTTFPLHSNIISLHFCYSFYTVALQSQYPKQKIPFQHK